jgi:hypothetical protein
LQVFKQVLPLLPRLQLPQATAAEGPPGGSQSSPESMTPSPHLLILTQSQNCTSQKSTVAALLSLQSAAPVAASQAPKHCFEQ